MNYFNKDFHILWYLQYVNVLLKQNQSYTDDDDLLLLKEIKENWYFPVFLYSECARAYNIIQILRSQYLRSETYHLK